MKHMKLTAEFYFDVTDEKAERLLAAVDEGRPILHKVDPVCLGISRELGTSWSYFVVRSFEEAK